MITQTVTVKEKGDQNIIIGRRGTCETEQIVFDITYLIETFGDGIAMLMVKRPSDTYAYPATVERDGNNVIWTVSEVDTGVKGHGECELFWYVNDATGLAKSVIYSVAILRDIAETYTDPPEAWETWVDEMSQLSAETMAYAEEAVDAASDALEAKADAVDAKDAAVIAQGAAETAAENAQSAASHYPKIEGGYWYVWTNGAWVNTGVKAEGVDGKGITSVVSAKTSTSGLVDTYTMTVTYTDNTHDTITFTVTNGRDGTDGTDGVSPTVTITTITGGHTVTITDADHPSGQSFDVMDGEVTNAVLNAALQTKAPIIKDTATGTIATFPDGTPGPMKIEASLAPIQDLHGYDAPWPPGGGKNLLPYPYLGTPVPSEITVTDNGDGTVTLNGTATGTKYFYFFGSSDTAVPDWVKPSTNYCTTLIPKPTGIKTQFILYGKNGESTIVIENTPKTTPSDFTNYRCAAVLSIAAGTYNNVLCKPILVEGSTLPDSWTPYSNICPISGHTGADVVRTGKNIFDITGTGAGTSFSVTATGGHIEVSYSASFSPNYIVRSGILEQLKQLTLKPGTYAFKAEVGEGSDYTYSSLTATFALADGTSVTVANGQSFTLLQNATLTTLGSEFKSVAAGKKAIVNYQIELGSTASAYVPFSGTTVTISFGQTVYGGTLVVNEDGTGSVVAEYGDVDLGELSWTAHTTSGVFYAPFSANADRSGDVFGYPYISSLWVYGTRTDYIFNGTANGLSVEPTSISGATRIYAYHEVYKGLTAQQFTSEMSGVHVVFELESPVTIPLTPGQVEALQGANCVWIDAATGAITVVHPCDTKLYIDKKIAEALAA